MDKILCPSSICQKFWYRLIIIVIQISIIYFPELSLQEIIGIRYFYRAISFYFQSFFRFIQLILLFDFLLDVHLLLREERIKWVLFLDLLRTRIIFFDIFCIFDEGKSLKGSWKNGWKRLLWVRDRFWVEC